MGKSKKNRPRGGNARESADPMGKGGNGIGAEHSKHVEEDDQVEEEPTVQLVNRIKEQLQQGTVFLIAQNQNI